MKVLFMKDATPTAIAGDVLEVKNGFARNYLMPRGIAVLATDAVIARSADLIAEAAKRRELAKQEWIEVAEKLGEAEIQLSVLSTPSGKLYGSITRGMVAAEVKKLIERDITAKSVQIHPPIRTTGSHKVQLNLHDGVTASLKLVVASDGEVSEEQAAAAEGGEAPAAVEQEDGEQAAAEQPEEGQEPAADAEPEQPEAA